jgi:hypothetical protein
MTGPVQHWFYMLERDAGEIPWNTFKSYYQSALDRPSPSTVSLIVDGEIPST